MSTRMASKRFSSEKSSVLTKEALADLNLHEFDVLPNWEPTTGKIYTKVRAISARINQNFDGWPSEELKKSYRTFLGKPVFVNHVNDDPRKARGVVVAARFVENGDDKFIEVIQEVDADKFPKLAHELISGGLDSVSMGAEARICKCSYCGNEASDMLSMCSHVLSKKGQVLGRVNDDGTREDVLVYEECRDVSFFELSYVFDPADETAVVSNVLTANRKRGYGETSLPPQVDTLRDEEEDLAGYFIDPPREFQEPDLDEDYPAVEEGQPLDHRRDEEQREDVQMTRVSRSPRQSNRRGRNMSHNRRARRRYAEEFGRNDQGEQEEVFISQTPPAEPVETGEGAADAPNNTKSDRVKTDQNRSTHTNLEARRRRARALARRRQADAERGTFKEIFDESTEFLNQKNLDEDAPDFIEQMRAALHEFKAQHGDRFDPSLYQAIGDAFAGPLDEPGQKSIWSSRRRRARALDRRRGSRRKKSYNPGEEVFFYTDEGIDPTAVGIVDKYPAVDPEGTVHEDLVQLRWMEDDGEWEDIVETNNLVPAGPVRSARRRARRRMAEQSDDFDLNSRADIARDVEDDEVFILETDPQTQPKDAARRRSSRRRVATSLYDLASEVAQKTGISEEEAESALENYLTQAEKVDGTSYDEDNLPDDLADFLAESVVQGISAGDFRNSSRKRRSSRRRRMADTNLDLAAPDGRVNVEAPVKDTTDEEAQASQFDKKDYGHNAGDHLADPDLSTDQNWAPGEGPKTSARASEIEGMRLAEAMVEAGLEDHEDRWKLAEAYTKLPANIVRDRIALLARTASAKSAVRDDKSQRPVKSARKAPGLGQRPTLQKSANKSDDYTLYL